MSSGIFYSLFMIVLYSPKLSQATVKYVTVADKYVQGAQYKLQPIIGDSCADAGALSSP